MALKLIRNYIHYFLNTSSITFFIISKTSKNLLLSLSTFVIPEEEYTNISGTLSPLCSFFH